MDPIVRSWLAATQSLQAEKFVIASKATLIIYDFLLTFGDEVALVWPSGLGFTELLFYVARYSIIPEMVLELLFLFGDLDQKTCRIVGGYLSFSLAFGMLAGQAIVVVRTWALWDGSRLFAAVMIPFGILSLGVGMFVSSEWTTHTEFRRMSTLSPALRGCALSSPYRLVYSGWALLCVNDVALMSLTIVRYRQRYCRGSPRLTSALYRDAFTYFSFTLVLAIGNLCVTVIAAAHYQLLLVGLERAMYTILACCIILNLRAAAQRSNMTLESVATNDVLAFGHEDGERRLSHPAEHSDTAP
ncbi:hypothetical protein AURDEDRAFT_185090 [Auricularia subglabra TFB-10046 SS5]|nr:hypothetical protein AURDEDRAFT_185090 [Auricularia subglabra TFB-10046 SS5]